MTPKEYLSQYRMCVQMIEDAMGDIEKARSDAEGLRAIIYDDMPKNHNVERDLSDAVAVIEEKVRRYRATVEVCDDLMRRIEMSIQTAPTRLQYRILRLKYIDGMKWQDIAHTVGKTRQWVNTQHGVALQNIKIYERDKS